MYIFLRDNKFQGSEGDSHEKDQLDMIAEDDEAEKENSEEDKEENEVAGGYKQGKYIFSMI